MHHTHEDIAYTLVARKEPKLSSTVKTPKEQHRAIVEGSVVPRESIDEQAQTYVSHLREHLLLEELKLFPALRVHTECLASLPPVDSIFNPLTDPKNSERYGAVRTRLQQT